MLLGLNFFKLKFEQHKSDAQNSVTYSFKQKILIKVVLFEILNELYEKYDLIENIWKKM